MQESYAASKPMTAAFIFMSLFSSCLAQVIFWVLGEYGAQADIGAAAVMEKVAVTAERQSLSDTARGYMLSTIAKLCAQVSPTASPTRNSGTCYCGSLFRHLLLLEQMALESDADPLSPTIPDSIFDCLLHREMPG